MENSASLAAHAPAVQMSLIREQISSLVASLRSHANSNNNFRLRVERTRLRLLLDRFVTRIFRS